MRRAGYSTTGLSALLLLIILSGCANPEPAVPPAATGTSSAAESPDPAQISSPTPCNAIIDYLDGLTIGGILYMQNYEGTKPVTSEQLGDKVGEVAYTLNGHACTDHVTQDGDAAFLPIGTEIYALKGYKPSFRVVADYRVYEVHNNPKAATMGDLLDIEGRVEKVGLESLEDGSLIGDFSPEATASFTRELLSLPMNRARTIGIGDDSRIFLRVQLKDGTSFRMVYYSEANAFHAGAFGTEVLKSLILTEIDRLQPAPGSPPTTT